MNIEFIFYVRRCRLDVCVQTVSVFGVHLQLQDVLPNRNTSAAEEKYDIYGLTVYKENIYYSESRGFAIKKCNKNNCTSPEILRNNTSEVHISFCSHSFGCILTFYSHRYGALFENVPSVDPIWQQYVFERSMRAFMFCHFVDGSCVQMQHWLSHRSNESA